MSILIMACALVATPANPPSPVALRSWDEAYVMASAMLARMNKTEKYTVMRGAGGIGKWGYVGNTVPITRLGIPSISMQDSGGGFRTTVEELVGTVTGWPSQVAFAATFDRDLVLRFATAMGLEFALKGANCILGPGLNVHRVARNGRNFEYLSAEDPYLGAQLVAPYVHGVQSMGVMATMKHFVFNQQESDRNSENNRVDDQTAWEIYYPPYQAAIDAGVSAAMCSYNRDNGVYSCSNDRRLNEDLKGKMGFRGFVMSDWGATHNTTIEEGLDMDMFDGDDGHFSDTNLAQHAVNESVVRILAAMYRMRVFENSKCDPRTTCSTLFKRNVTSNHSLLAREAATDSIVLLKNEGLLPIRRSAIGKIAVVGSAAIAGVEDPGKGAPWNQGDYYSGGGSGHVVGHNLVTPLDGIRRRANAAGIEVIASTSDDVPAAISTAMQADVTIVVAGTICGEAWDRKNLSLDYGIDDMIASLTNSTSTPVVALAEIPAAIVIPWHRSVAAVLALFYGGQETGNAWASVLFGDRAPAGRLPLEIPESALDVIEPYQTLISSSTVNYTEGMATSYRNKSSRPAFPFGHGLTYTEFSYGTPSVMPCNGDVCVSLNVTNSGEVAARDVPQLYVEFPAEAAHPAPFLKGFQKTGLIQPGESASVTFHLLERDLSYYSPLRPGRTVLDAGRACIGTDVSSQAASTTSACQHFCERTWGCFAFVHSASLCRLKGSCAQQVPMEGAISGIFTPAWSPTTPEKPVGWVKAKNVTAHIGASSADIRHSISFGTSLTV